MSVMDIQTDKHRQTCRIMTVNTTLAHKEPHSKNENTSSYKRKMPNCCKITVLWTITPHHNRFMALFQGPPRWASARRELLNFMVQGKIKRGRHTDHPAGHHSIQTNQCPPPPSTPFFTGRMPFLPPNQQCQSTEGTVLCNSVVKKLYRWFTNLNWILDWWVYWQANNCLVRRVIILTQHCFNATLWCQMCKCVTRQLSTVPMWTKCYL